MSCLVVVVVVVVLVLDGVHARVLDLVIEIFDLGRRRHVEAPESEARRASEARCRRASKARCRRRGVEGLLVGERVRVDRQRERVVLDSKVEQLGMVLDLPW